MSTRTPFSVPVYEASKGANDFTRTLPSAPLTTDTFEPSVTTLSATPSPFRSPGVRWPSDGTPRTGRSTTTGSPIGRIGSSMM